MKTYTDLVKEEKTYRPKARIDRFHFGTDFTGVEIELASDMYGGEISDTTVKINEAGVVCVIAGDSIESFKKELNDIINKYAI